MIGLIRHSASKGRTVRRQSLAATAVAVMAALGGCSAFMGASGGPEPEPDDYPILWEKAGTYCDINRPMQLVARNQAEMALCPLSDVPVDFTKEMVLIAALGRVTSPGYAVRIHRVWRDGSILRVDVRIYRPPPTTQSSIELAAPYHVVIVPRSSLNVDGFSPQPRPERPGTASPLFTL
jgi:hypothetical protein